MTSPSKKRRTTPAKKIPKGGNRGSIKNPRVGSLSWKLSNLMVGESLWFEIEGGKSASVEMQKLYSTAYRAGVNVQMAKFMAVRPGYEFVVQLICVTRKNPEWYRKS